MKDRHNHIAVIGGGFTGLAAAYEIARQGAARVTVIEEQEQLGGLAGSFEAGGAKLERFYHHCFKSDRHIIELAGELGCGDRLVWSRSRTGIYLGGEFYKLSTPLDVLRFGPLSLADRIRLGSLVLKARRVRDYRDLESVTAEQWLLKLCGKEVYRVVWEPLLRGKFGRYASEISAVWFWNKIVLRGGSRGRAGGEVLGYYRGGFGTLAEKLAEAVRAFGGTVRTGVRVEGLVIENGGVRALQTTDGLVEAKIVISTVALPILAELLERAADDEYAAGLRRIRYLANVCLVLELSEGLSDIYWLNVNDPEFPFVGLIEHTNFQPAELYAGEHIVYLSKYLEPDAELYRMSDEQIYEYSLPHIERVFPSFKRGWVHRYHIWRSRYAQPVVECRYSGLIPSHKSPIKGLYIASMAQIYPEDRGINYSIAQCLDIGRLAPGTLGQ